MPLKTCSFCKREIPVGKGIMYVKTDGTILYFCSSKCKKSMIVFHRNPMKVKWVRVLERKRIAERRAKRARLKAERERRRKKAKKEEKTKIINDISGEEYYLRNYDFHEKDILLLLTKLQIVKSVMKHSHSIIAAFLRRMAQ